MEDIGTNINSPTLNFVFGFVDVLLPDKRFSII